MNFRTTLIIIIVFALSAGGYFLFLDGGEEIGSGENEKPRISEVYGLSVDTVQRIRLSFNDSAYDPLSLAKDDNGAWQLTAPIAAYANEGKVTEMLGDLLNKQVKRTLEVPEYSQYGLDQPTVRVDLWRADETVPKSFLIGKKTVNYSVYAKEASE
ncbi:MAG: DUF4340 domain-containing protein, partial [Candidatus Poribacteria bacterium]|nr:DUF4340 domain-containing protein [Candidatus Poribacteria bacterium]